MSLTNFVSQSDVQVILRDFFELPDPIPFGHAQMQAPPRTRNYALVGTAFDYLLRLYVEGINPLPNIKKDVSWVADRAPEILIQRGQKGVAKDVSRIVQLAKRHRYQFLTHKCLNKTLIEMIFDEELYKDVILLAQIDQVYRGRNLPIDWQCINDFDLEDLNNLVQAIPASIFQARRNYLLNPTFGKASRLVLGADADLIIDEMIIDIKTTKYLELKDEYIAQLLGYLLLSEIAKESIPSFPVIYELGIYYSRHSYLFKFPVRPKSPFYPRDEIKWFKARAKEYRDSKFL